MRNAVLARVAHLVLHRVLVDMLPFVCESRLNVVLLLLCLEQQLGTFYVRLKIVARMLEVGAYAQVLARLGLCEPVLTLYVVLLLLARVEC